MEITAIICLMCTIVGCLVGYFGFRRNQNNDIRTETKLIVSNTRWYLNTMSDTATGDIIYNLGAGKPTQIIADCAYL